MDSLDNIISHTEDCIVAVLETDGQSETSIINMMNSIYRLVYELNLLKVNRISIISEKEKLTIGRNLKEGMVRNETLLSTKALNLNKIMLYLNAIDSETVKVIMSLV